MKGDGVPPGVAEPGAAEDERPLLTRHAEGDPEAFPALVASYRAPVYSYLSRCGVNPADRDDVFQAVFLRIHRAAGQYRPERPSHPWIFTIVANEVRSYLRRRRVRQLIFAAAPKADPPDAAPDGERALEARQAVERLEQALGQLSLPQREVLVLAGIQGLPLKDVAEALALPLNTVKTQLRRARLSLARKLSGRSGARPAEEPS